MTVTQPFPIHPGDRPVPIQVGATPPAGMTLINPGDHGGTVWISAGPNGAAVPLTPGGSLRWTDPATYPYATLAADAAAAETVVVTGQLDNFADPAAVAAATATQLLATGVPSVLTGGTVWQAGDQQSNNVTALARGATAPVLDVSKYASLYVTVNWSSPAGVGDYGPAVMRFGFPNQYFLGTGNSQWNTPDVATFVVPVMGPTLTLFNAQAPASFVSVYGTNRPAPGGRFAHIPDPTGVRTIQATNPGTANTFYQLGGADGLGTVTRLTGPLTLDYNLSGPGSIFWDYVAPNGQVLETAFNFSAGGAGTMPFSSPLSAGVLWRWRPSTAVAGAFAVLTLVSS